MKGINNLLHLIPQGQIKILKHIGSKKLFVMKEKNMMRRIDDFLGSSYLTHTDYGQTQGSGLTLRSRSPL